MLNARWSRSPWSKVTLHSRQNSPAREGQLVELEQLVERLAVLGEERGQRDDAGQRDDHQRQRDPRSVAPAAREVALRGAGVAGLLVEPAEPAGDLGLVLRGRPSIGFAVGRDRAVQVAIAHPRRRDVPPRGVCRRRLRQFQDGHPARDRLGLVVEPVVRLAEAEQRRGGDHRVVETDDAIEVQASVGEIA